MSDWLQKHMERQLEQDQKGGPGSGHHGHAGRPGKRGGSAPGKGGDRGRWRKPVPPVIPGGQRPSLLFGSHITGTVRMNEEEQRIVTEAVGRFEDKLPANIGAEGTIPITIDSRRPGPRESARAITNGLNIFINRQPGIFDDVEGLAGTLAHEFGHVMLDHDNKLQGRFEQVYGKGPYSRGTAGITSVGGLQNSAELFSTLFRKYAMGETVPEEFAGILEK